MKKLTLTLAALLAMTAAAAAQMYAPSRQQVPVYEDFPTMGSPYATPVTTAGPGFNVPPGGSPG